LLCRNKFQDSDIINLELREKVLGGRGKVIKSISVVMRFCLMAIRSSCEGDAFGARVEIMLVDTGLNMIHDVRRLSSFYSIGECSYD